jgi:NAD-dependent deacetylase
MQPAPSLRFWVRCEVGLAFNSKARSSSRTPKWGQTYLVIDEDLLRRFRGNVLVLTGAGISVASGLPTFRGNEGLYEGLNPYELASPEAFADHPVTVWNWYAMRIHQGKGAQPNAAHRALVELEGLARGFTLITSNVDPLHERAGSRRVYKLHGDILETRCLSCRAVEPLDISTLPQSFTSETLPTCGCGGRLRPNVVWFGESPSYAALEAAQRAIPIVDIGLEVGASGVVSYGFSEILVALGTPLVRINPDAVAERGVTVIAEGAEVALPALVRAVRG